MLEEREKVKGLGQQTDLPRPEPKYRLVPVDYDPFEKKEEPAT